MNIYVITGPIQTGKTTWTGKMLERARELGVRVTGVWTPAVFEDGNKTGIQAELLPSRERFPFAAKRGQWRPGSAPKEFDGKKRLGWDFSEQAIQRINDNFKAVRGNLGDLFVVDEFGALEFHQGKGFTVGLEIMDAREPKNAFLVLRPDLLEPARERWGEFQVLSTNSDIEAFLAKVSAMQ